MWTVEQKERDIEYQRKRVRLFRELLANYPETRPQIIQEAKKDIPPVLRGALWGALLNIPTFVHFFCSYSHTAGMMTPHPIIIVDKRSAKRHTIASTRRAKDQLTSRLSWIFLAAINIMNYSVALRDIASSRTF
jgi:hypothetical protein